jgi:hypothetical protein
MLLVKKLNKIKVRIERNEILHNNQISFYHVI